MRLRHIHGILLPGRLRTKSRLRRVVDTGAPVTEIFLNTLAIGRQFYSQTARGGTKFGIEVSSVHPFFFRLHGRFFDFSL